MIKKIIIIINYTKHCERKNNNCNNCLSLSWIIIIFFSMFTIIISSYSSYPWERCPARPEKKKLSWLWRSKAFSGTRQVRPTILQRLRPSGARDGFKTQGSYFVPLPNGRSQRATYTNSPGTWSMSPTRLRHRTFPRDIFKYPLCLDTVWLK